MGFGYNTRKDALSKLKEKNFKLVRQADIPRIFSTEAQTEKWTHTDVCQAVHTSSHRQTEKQKESMYSACLG